MARFVVKRHRPWQWALSVVILSMLMATFTWLLLDRSYWSVIRGRLQDNHEQKALWQTNQSLSAENGALRERVLILERTTSLDKQTAVLLQDELKSMQGRIYDITEELEFYQGIMDAAAEAKGLDVHGIHISALLQQRHYALKVILTNVAGSGSVVEGVMDIAIEGQLDGLSKRLTLPALSPGEVLDLRYNVRNFERFESNIVLPPDFKAQRVFVELKPKSKKQPAIRKVFDWPVSVH